MTRDTLGITGLPSKMDEEMRRLGADIRLARQRRNMTQQMMAESMFVTAKTVRRVEAGDPGVSLGVYAAALFVLGFMGRLAKLAAPEMDTWGNWQQRKKAPKRVRTPKDDELDF
ncbi:MAG: helix-turn-helix transcriptional regulator [Syntrophales bacterium]|nr:helix-turn-helix transcriptional regulator [Syntrophales bacterium]